MTTFQVRVLSATKDALKGGSGAQYEHLVDVIATDHIEARLVACQMAACHPDDPMPLSAEVITDSTLTDEFSSPTQTQEVKRPMSLTDEVTHRAEVRWGHPLDSVDRSAVALVIADRVLHDVAGTDEASENAAFHVQHGAFDTWWAECRRAERDCNHPEMDAAWIRDLSYGGAVSAVDDFLSHP